MDALPPLSSLPIVFHSYPTNSPQSRALDLEIEAMVSKEAVEEIFPPFTAGFYAHIFIVHKGDSGMEWRPI